LLPLPARTSTHLPPSAPDVAKTLDVGLDALDLGGLSASSVMPAVSCMIRLSSEPPSLMSYRGRHVGGDRDRAGHTGSATM